MNFKKYINEEFNPLYEVQMIKIFNKSITDELEASINYKIMAEQIQGPGVNLIKSELINHSFEEFEHFNKLITYAADHNFLNSVDFQVRSELVNPKNLPKDVSGIVQFSQDLEQEAFSDYKAAAVLAQKEGDNETRVFFESLMTEEMKHFDDISDLDNTGRTRKLNEI